MAETELQEWKDLGKKALSLVRRAISRYLNDLGEKLEKQDK